MIRTSQSGVDFPHSSATRRETCLELAGEGTLTAVCLSMDGEGSFYYYYLKIISGKKNPDYDGLCFWGKVFMAIYHYNLMIIFRNK